MAIYIRWIRLSCLRAMWGRCYVARRTRNCSRVCLIIIVLLTIMPAQPTHIIHGHCRMDVRCSILSSRFVISRRNRTALVVQLLIQMVLPLQANNCCGIQDGINTPLPLSLWLIWGLSLCQRMRCCRNIFVQEAMGPSLLRITVGRDFRTLQRIFRSILTPCM